MNKKLTRDILKNILQAKDIDTLTLDEITQMFLTEQEISRFAPDGVCEIDPRNGDRIVFNSARAHRPHDNRLTGVEHTDSDVGKECLICQGKTTNVIDIADLSEGFTFINKNLYPVFYPSNRDNIPVIDGDWKRDAMRNVTSHGFHFLQWSSSYHDRDWHNMPLADRLIVMRRLAALEKKMLSGSGTFVSIIKNYGHLVGGSLHHGHQQIAVSNIMPNRHRQNKEFMEKNGVTFSEYMLHENSPELIIQDYGAAVLLTPYYMRRPYDMLLLLKDTKKAYIHSLDNNEYEAVCDGWQDAIRIMTTVMPQIGRETAYTIVTHNGPGAGLYFEFLPYTQEMGGFEHLGIYLCQGNPVAAADLAREILSHFSR